MKVAPVTLDQSQVGRDGRRYLVTGEAGQIAKELAAIEGVELVSYFNETHGIFEVAQVVRGMKDYPDGREFLVVMVEQGDWNPEFVAMMQERAYELRHGVSQADRLDKLDDQSTRDSEYRFEQELGEAAAPLMRAVQRDLGFKPRISVPRAVSV